MRCVPSWGRAAELFVGQISSGAMNDLEQVTKQAYAMVTYMGMSDKLPNLLRLIRAGIRLLKTLQRGYC